MGIEQPGHEARATEVDDLAQARIDLAQIGPEGEDAAAADQDLAASKGVWREDLGVVQQGEGS